MDKNYEWASCETKWREAWERSGIYRFDPASEKPVFSVDTPPPYVSSFSLHPGHAMSYIQAEIIVRHRRMQGHNIFYPMGFDDNGLPTERYVEKKYKLVKSKVSMEEFIRLCIQETAEGARNYREVWERLGIGVDWSLTYNTIGGLAQEIAQRSFIDLCVRGLAYQKEAPCLWCPSCRTALAQADIETHEVTKAMHQLRFSLASGDALTIATTRPEMLPACVALCFHPEDQRYAALANQQATVPFFGFPVPILAHRDVKPEFGTGLMMVCTWGDKEDVRKCLELGLSAKPLLGEDGKLGELAGRFAGLGVQEARKQILEVLVEHECLSGPSGEIGSVQEVHDRCGSPVEFFRASQWFVRLLSEKDGLLRRGDELSWMPDFMKERYDQWVNGLEWDWCISRDRYYGVPFPVWKCVDCQSVILAKDEWLPVDPRLDKDRDVSCPECSGRNIVPENQVMDTWMTSSLTPLINARWGRDDSLQEKIYPMSLRVQAFEIIRTWLFYTVAKSHYHTGSLPWKAVMISGWGLDAHGKKMSKSEGNFVAIADVLKNHSADAVRWWATGSGLGQNLRFSERDVKDGQRVVTKLWNASRFVTEILDRFDPSGIQTGPVANASDLWILAELQALVESCTTHLEQCEYNRARIALEKFFWMYFCDNYLELCKDRSWHPEKYVQEQIGSMAFTLRSALGTLLKLFAPILPFVTEELYHAVFGVDDSESIHVQPWPSIDPSFADPELVGLTPVLLELFGRIRHYKGEVLKSHKASVPALSVISDDKLVLGFTSDLAGLARAESFLINEEIPDGHEYAVGSTRIVFQS
jgi:valyl-tRNA synthetase